MKPFDKKEKSESSASDDSPPQRPKRNTCQKTAVSFSFSILKSFLFVVHISDCTIIMIS